MNPRPAAWSDSSPHTSHFATVKIVELRGGNHNDFLFSQRAEVVAAMRDFLSR